MEPICFLLYVSQVASSAEESALLALREKAQLSGANPEITGLLLYRRGFFMQYLEGPNETIIKLFRRLRATNSHSNVRVMGQGSFSKRLFADWSIWWVANQSSSPSSEALIDLLETVLSSKTISSDEIAAVLRRFGRDATPMVASILPKNSMKRFKSQG